MSADDVKYLIVNCSRRCNGYANGLSPRDCDYHFCVHRDGTMTQHRMLLETGGYCALYNHNAIGIYCEDVDECGTMTERQQGRVNDLLAILRLLFPHARTRMVLSPTDLTENTDFVSNTDLTDEHGCFLAPTDGAENTDLF